MPNVYAGWKEELIARASYTDKFQENWVQYLNSWGVVHFTTKKPSDKLPRGKKAICGAKKGLMIALEALDNPQALRNHYYLMHHVERDRLCGDCGYVLIKKEINAEIEKIIRENNHAKRLLQKGKFVRVRSGAKRAPRTLAHK